MKGQSAVMDGIFFMLVCGAAATLLFYTAGLSGSNTSRQIATIYNYEYAGTALVTLHYAQDADNNWFWNELKLKLADSDPEGSIQEYVKPGFAGEGQASEIWNKLTASAPSQDLVLYFSGVNPFYCHGDDSTVFRCGAKPGNLENKTVFASSVKIIDDNLNTWDVIMQLYY